MINTLVQIQNYCAKIAAFLLVALTPTTENIPSHTIAQQPQKDKIQHTINFIKETKDRTTATIEFYKAIFTENHQVIKIMAPAKIRYASYITQQYLDQLQEDFPDHIAQIEKNLPQILQTIELSLEELKSELPTLLEDKKVKATLSDLKQQLPTLLKNYATLKTQIPNTTTKISNTTFELPRNPRIY